MSTSKNEDNKALLNKHLDYLEKLKAENDNLKAKLIEERARCEFMEQEIEVENKPLGYDFSKSLVIEILTPLTLALAQWLASFIPSS